MKEQSKRYRTRAFVDIWLALANRRQERAAARPLRQGRELEELVRERAPYINDLIEAVEAHSTVIREVWKVLERARCFSTGEIQMYPFMVPMEEAIADAGAFTPAFYRAIQQSRLLLAEKKDATLLTCVKQTMTLQEQAVQLREHVMEYIHLFEQLVEDDDERGLRRFVRNTCQPYFQLQDMYEELQHYSRLYRELNKVYMPQRVADYNRDPI